MGKQWKQWQTSFFLGSKITADGDFSHEIKRRLLLGRKAVINVDSILKTGDITLLTKLLLVKAMVFPVVMYGCESWTMKKAEHQRIDAFELWCWRRLLRVPWTARRSNKNIHWCWSWNSNTLATCCEELIIWKDSDAGRNWGWEEKGTTEDEIFGWHHWLDGNEFEQALGVCVGQGSLTCCSPWGCKESDTPERLNWELWTTWIWTGGVHLYAHYLNIYFGKKFLEICSILKKIIDELHSLEILKENKKVDMSWMHKIYVHTSISPIGIRWVVI